LRAARLSGMQCLKQESELPAIPASCMGLGYGEKSFFTFESYLTFIKIFIRKKKILFGTFA
jgi:hypothetical protein